MGSADNLVDLRHLGPQDFLEILKDAAPALLEALMASPRGELLPWTLGHLQKALGFDLAYLAELSRDPAGCLEILHVSGSDSDLQHAGFDLQDTHCAAIVERELCYSCSDLASLFPKDPILAERGCQSFVGMTLLDSEAQPAAVLVLLHRGPISEDKARSASAHLRVLRSQLESALIHRMALDEAKIRSALVAREVSDSEHRKSVRDLAKGIAHDFNNILFAVSGQAYLVDRMYENDADLREQMSVILAACQQASGLCEQLVVYSGSQPAKKADVDLNEVVAGCQRIASVLAQSNKAQIAYELTAEPVMMHGSIVRLQQILMHLLKNAADASPLKGTIRIRVLRRQLLRADFAEAIVGNDYPEGEYAVLEVEDEGAGVPESKRSRIFTPFFSTKDAGQGMGLAVVMGGAKEHDAAIFIRSEPSKGSRFQVCFPIGTTPQALATPLPSQARPQVGPGRKVLVIDDDDLVRQTIVRILNSEDFEVASASSGQEGLDVVREMASSISAVVLDYAMPMMQGDEVLMHLRKIAPGIPVLMVSGNVSDVQIESFSDRPDAFLAKPVLPDMLVDTVRTLIRS